MALYDRKMTKKLEKACNYFSELKHEARDSPTGKAEIKNREMLEAAAWASSFLSSPSRAKAICEKIRKGGYTVNFAVDCMSAQDIVNETVASFGEGIKTSGKYTFQQMQRVCNTVINYVRVLNEEKAVKLYYQKLNSGEPRKRSFTQAEKRTLKEISRELDLSVKEVKGLLKGSMWRKQTILEDFYEDVTYACNRT
jgi:hypothetical protein